MQKINVLYMKFHDPEGFRLHYAFVIPKETAKTQTEVL
jgi:hypothetical protein